MLAASALSLSALARAGFAYRDGVPRVYVPASCIAFVLAAATAAEHRSLSSVLFFAGCALVEVGFLAAFRTEP